MQGWKNHKQLSRETERERKRQAEHKTEEIVMIQAE